MRGINRSAVIVIKTQAFLDWLHQADPTSGEVTLEDVRREPSVYLLPVYDTDEQARRHLKGRCREIFEEQLDGWYRVPSSWPAKRDFTTFSGWFEWQFYSAIFDLSPNLDIYDEY